MLLAQFVACEGAPSGASEAFRVREGAFVEGDLPYDDDATTPLVYYAASTAFIATQGQGNLGYSGLASKDAYSVAVWFPEVSTGHWIVPVDGPDVTQEGNLLFDLTVDFGRDAPYDLTALEFVAIDADGNAGPRYAATVCVLPDYADDNYAVCAPGEIPPQHTLISLRWDTDVDLDLVVVTPDGKVVTGKSPTTAVDADGDGELDTDVSIGELSRDSNANCVVDRVNLESLVFAEEPPAGDYLVYASLYSACDAAYVNYSASLYQRVSEDSFEMTETSLPHGALLAAQATAGATLGTYLTTLTLP